MSDENLVEPSSPSNVISDDTGGLDVRFALWRKFCAENSVAVDTLPSELSEEVKGKWEKLKEEDLTKPDELK
jgi:hypothetical protein